MRPATRRWGTGIGLGANVLTLLLAALLAAGLSKALWGYWFVRPGVDPRVLGARRVHSVTWIEQMQQADGSWALARDPRRYGGPGWYEREKVAWPDEYDYYLLTERSHWPRSSP